MDAYNVIVIGTGTAAQVVSSRVRRTGRSVAIIDHRLFGGTCALRGCDPKKMLVSGAEAADWARRMHRRGVAGDLRIDWKRSTYASLLAWGIPCAGILASLFAPALVRTAVWITA